MLTNLKASMLTAMLMAWSTIAVAQTSPGGATPPAGTTTDAAAGGMDWLWIIALVAVVAVVLFYFLGRGRSTRI
jgi:hypothetical protein